MKTKYGPKQIVAALKHTVVEQKKNLNKSAYPQNKLHWIKEVSNKVLDLIEKEFETYNRINYNDQLKEIDLISCLATATNWLLKHSAVKIKRD